jgi:hypothetical protein
MQQKSSRDRAAGSDYRVNRPHGERFFAITDSGNDETLPSALSSDRARTKPRFDARDAICKAGWTRE